MSEDLVVAIIIAILIVLSLGDPDLLDAIIRRVGNY